MKRESIKRNIFYQMLYEILVLILPFITSPYIARVIGAEGVGIYSYSYSIANYFVLFSMLGIKNYGNRVIAQSKGNQNLLNTKFSNLLTLHIGVSLICLLLYVVYMVFYMKNQIYAVIMGAVVASALFDISWFYFGMEKFKLTVTRNTIIKIANVMCIFIFVHSKDDLWKYCAIYAFGILISQLALWLPLKKYVAFVKPCWSEVSIHIKPMFVLFIPTIAISLYKYMDKIMISAQSGNIQLGFYENAEKMINIPMTVITSFGTVMLPKMSNLMVENENKVRERYMHFSMKYVMLLAFALCFGLAGVGRVFAPVFWGEEFELSGILLMGLAVTIPFMAFANIIRTQYLIPAEKDREYVLSVVIGAVVNLAINFLLIPKYGAFGATIGTIAAEVSVCLVQSFSVKSELPLKQYVKNARPFLVIGLFMFIGVYELGVDCGIHLKTLIMQIISGGIFYCVFSFFYLYISKDIICCSAVGRIFKKKSETGAKKKMEDDS